MKTIHLLKLLVVSLALTGFSAFAITISYSDYGVGYWTPGNEFNSDPDLPTGVQRSVDIWNGAAPAGFWDPPGNDDATFFIGSGTLVPAVLPDVTGYVDRDNGSPFSMDNSSGLYTYMTAKYGNGQQQVFYIKNVLDVIEVQTSLPGINGSGLSHIAWLTAEDVRVPDGGVTVMFLGMGLSMLGMLQRKLR